MKTLISIGFAVAALCAALMQPLVAHAGYEDLFASTKAASWAIYTRGTGGMQASCSATAIKTDAKRTHLLTAGHCFLGIDLKRTDFLVTQDHFNFYPANIYETGLKLKRGMQDTSTDLDHYSGDDWAVVEAKVGDKPTLPLGKSEDLRIGQDLLVVGVPFGVDFLAVQGIVDAGPGGGSSMMIFMPISRLPKDLWAKVEGP